ncbi:MAG: hypothetical protein JSS72_09940 [Armatimonadetes bacterium]|nr:hypothetical protein [Armatimonadota bacterium]
MIRWDRTKGRPEPIRALNRIIERENGEPLVDLRIEAPRLVIIRPAAIPFLRKTVADMLNRAIDALPQDRQLGLIDAWRPLARQQRIYDFFMNCALEAYPERPHSSLRRTVCRWVAPTDQPAPPGHCTGAAIDVHLLDAAGELIDVSAPYDRFKAAPTFTLGLSEEAQKERSLLYEAMVSAGFSNCRDEWWHYSYGDAGWAVRLGLEECFYGLAAAPVEDYSAWEELHVASMSERTNPFV